MWMDSGQPAQKPEGHGLGLFAHFLSKNKSLIKTTFPNRPPPGIYTSRNKGLQPPANDYNHAPQMPV